MPARHTDLAYSDKQLVHTLRNWRRYRTTNSKMTNALWYIRKITGNIYSDEINNQEDQEDHRQNRVSHD